ncbi:MAG: hypothetical protein ACREL7_04380 [Longimicrobiales bacterium]
MSGKGTENAPLVSRNPILNGDPEQEASIRTLSVSLLAVAAIAASLLITRTRDDALAHAGEGKPAEQSLDAIRAAGL